MRNSSLQIDEKRSEILNCSEHLLVIGGPGSGKTTISLLKAFQYIDHKGLCNGQKVLFLSFSRNARARIEESARSFIEYNDLWSQLVIETFHSFFLNILKTHGYLVGVQNPIQIILPHQDDAIKSAFSNKADLEKEYQRLMREEGKITFDAFSTLTSELLKKSNKIIQLLSQCYPLIIIDEAQDTDSLQWSILQGFKKYSQLIFLGDLDQQIFDYRPDVNPERIEEIKKDLNPLIVDLSDDNHRNPGNEIRKCAMDVRSSVGFSNNYESVNVIRYAPIGDTKDKFIIQALARMYKTLKKEGIINPSICFLCSYNKGTIMVSKALLKKNIKHELIFDETAAIYSGLLISSLLEPIGDTNDKLKIIFTIFQEYYFAKNNISEAEKYERWINSLKTDNLRSTKATKFWIEFLNKLSFGVFTGVPKDDWIFIRESLLSSGVVSIVKFAKNSRLLFAFQSGKRLNELLSAHWIDNGDYKGAQGFLQKAMTEAQLERKSESYKGIYVMTTYKSKGKEFDGVILFQNNYHSPIDLIKDGNLEHARKVFYVAVTRAKSKVTLLLQHGADCQILL